MLNRRNRVFRQRLHSAAAVTLLALYAAAAWHGAGDHHHPAQSCESRAGCAPSACAPEPAAHSHGDDHAPDHEHSESHACALCTLLHAPATPGVMLAAPAVQPTLQAAPAAPSAAPAVFVAGNPPSRAPPFLSA